MLQLSHKHTARIKTRVVTANPVSALIDHPAEHSLTTSPDYSIYQSNGLCFDTCKDQYAFAVVQYQNCWCSNIVPSQQVDVGDCSEQCPGYPDELCGNRGSGLYGYVALSRAPSGTAGGGASRTQSQEQVSLPTFGLLGSGLGNNTHFTRTHARTHTITNANLLGAHHGSSI